MLKKNNSLSVKKNIKSSSILDKQITLKFFKQKRNSCVYGHELIIMEESTKYNVENAIYYILQKVQQKINQNNKMAKYFLNQIQKQLEIVKQFDPLNDAPLILQQERPIILQNQPTSQQNYAVIKNKYNKNLEANGNILNQNQSSNRVSQISIKNEKNRISNKNLLVIDKLSSLGSGILKNSNKIKINLNSQVKERTKRQKDTKQVQQKLDIINRQQLIKRLKRQYQKSKSQKVHACPEPLTIDFRPTFSEPQDKNIEQIRFYYLKQKQKKEQMNRKLKSTARRSSTVHQFTDSSKNILKLPLINKGKQNKANRDIFAQGQDGQIIKIKNHYRMISQPNAQFSFSELIQCKIKQQSFINSMSERKKKQIIKNQKIKTFQFSDSSALISKSIKIDQEQMQKQILQKVAAKKGVIIKKSIKALNSLNSQSIKFPNLIHPR